MSIQIVEIAQPSVIDTVAVAQPSTVAVVEVRQGVAGGAGPNEVTSATTSDGTADLLLANVETVTAEVTDTLIAPHIHGNLAGSVYAHVRAGEALEKGDPVYVSGSHGSGADLIAIVSKADASNAAKMPAVGIVDEDIENNANGHMVITGTITELNTAAYSINAELYVAAGGGITATPPTARAQPVARVERANANNGAILVKVNGLSASDATPSALVRRDASGGASLEYPTFGSGFQITETGGTDTFGMRSAAADTWSMYGPDYGDFMSFSKAGGINFSPSSFAYAAGADSAHRTALGLGTGDSPTFGGADFFTSTTTTLNVYNTLSGANFERLSFRWVSNVARIGTAKGGTGSARDLVLETDGTERVRVTAAGVFSVDGVRIGRGAGAVSTNTAVGSSALTSNTTGGINTALGASALTTNTTGSGNTAIGNQALLSNTATNNTGIGQNAIANNSTGNANVAVGARAGRNIADGTTSNAITSNSLYIGVDTKALASGQTNQIVIGFDAIGLGSNTAVLGNDSIITTALKGNVGIGTTTPASKLTVTGGDAEVTDSASGIILKSPDGTRWRVTVDNTGALTTTSLA